MSTITDCGALACERELSNLIAELIELTYFLGDGDALSKREAHDLCRTLNKTIDVLTELRDRMARRR